MMNQNSKVIFKSTRVADGSDLAYIIIAAVFFISFGIYGNFWVGYVIGIIFAIAPFLERIITIYDNGLRVERNLFFYKTECFIQIEDFRIFRNDNGSDIWNRYGVGYIKKIKLKRDIKTVSFYISKKRRCRNAYRVFYI